MSAEKKKALRSSKIFRNVGIDCDDIGISIKPQKEKKKKYMIKKKPSDRSTTDTIKKKIVTFKVNLYDIIYVPSYKKYNKAESEEKPPEKEQKKKNSTAKCCTII